MVPSKFLKVTTWGRISTKCDNKLGNKIEKIWHALKESNVWGCNSNITRVNDLNMWYFISLMIKADIPCLELAYLLQLMVQTLNEIAIYHIRILAQHEMAPNTFLQNTQYSFKNQRSMHGNDWNILFWSQLKFRITFQLQFLEWNIFILFYL